MTARYIEAKPCHVRKDVIDDFGASVANDLGYTPGASMKEIVRKLGGRLTYQSFDDLNDDASIKVKGLKNFDIFLPRHTTEERDRFSIAHELGHYLLHYPIEKRPMAARRFGSNRVEWEANWFAAGFLMPKKQFRERYSLCEGDLGSVARHFKVSVAAAEARAKALGLI